MVRAIYEAGLRDEDAVARAAIPVEQIDGPVLLVSGVDDAMWPATPMAEMLAARATANGRTGQVAHLRYERAGHLLSREARAAVAQTPAGRLIDFGGTPEGDAAAGEDAMPRIIDFVATART